ncbi:MAG TPA: alpha-galactosidase [Candidatus Hydrogenedentes bacterium]|nr:alpha-galactosidase [Candidatus Hydrogenedentota bacterium]
MIRGGGLACFLFLSTALSQPSWAGCADDLFLPDTGRLPFSFTYDGKTYSGQFPAAWEKGCSSHKPVAQQQKQTFTWTDSDTGLTIKCDVIFYRDFDAVEWVLHLINNSTNETPLLENIHVADFPWDGVSATNCELHYAEGSHERITDFQPLQKSLEENTPAVFTPFGGRPSDGFLPFFNLASPPQGIVIALGWTGQWTASFTRNGNHVRVQAGLETAHFKMMPNETIRMPSVLVMPWQGDDRMVGQNRFRQLLLKQYVPRYDDAPVKPLMAASPHAVVGFEKTTEANMIDAIHNIAARRLPVDYFWIDAGWFLCPGNNWARGVGNFQPDTERFPHGLKPVADAAHAAGLKFLLWFEPERIMPDTSLYKEHPDWLLKPPSEMPDAIRYQFNDHFHLLDLAKPEAAKWLTETVNKAITDTGIDAYRNDFNMYPSFYWRASEAPDRQGIKEIEYVQALYRYFDALRQQHPQLLLDTCASGGRRIDLEMIKRALILTRSDYLWDPTGQQCHTYGLAQWLPITGIGSADIDRYKCRSGYGSHFSFAVDYFSKDNAVWESARTTLEECKTLAPLFRKDFYPLTPYSTANNVWMAWQFHDPEKQQGLIQAFRRQDCPDDAITCILHGLDPKSIYAITNLDTHAALRIAGSDLLSKGFTITLQQKPAAALFTYTREK